MNKYIDSWKNEKVFEKQLELNLKELNTSYPFHWKCFIEFVGKIEPKINSILDVACGSGIYSELCRKHFPNIKYTGIDYAQQSIDLATKTWPNATFYKMDYNDLTEKYVKRFDLVNACSLHNVLQNGDEALDFFLKLEPKYLILGKLLTTRDRSNYTIYEAHGEITTYLYYHNIDGVKNMFKNHGYKTYCNNSELPTEFLLIKK